MNENDGSTARGFDPGHCTRPLEGRMAREVRQGARSSGASPPRRGQRYRPPSGCPRRSSDHFRAGGRGWQTRIDHALRDWIKQHDVA